MTRPAPILDPMLRTILAGVTPPRLVYVTCPECDGAQYVESYNPDLSATPKMIECSRCNGFGEIRQKREVS